MNENIYDINATFAEIFLKLNVYSVEQQLQ